MGRGGGLGLLRAEEVREARAVCRERELCGNRAGGGAGLGRRTEVCQGAAGTGKGF